MNIKIDRDRTQTYADVDMGDGVLIELVRANDGTTWEVWGVRIDDTLYREPRDLEGESLVPGPFGGRLDAALDKFLFEGASA